MVVLKLIVLGFFVVVGWNYTHAANWRPFAPNGWTGVQAGAAIVFFAYIGFDAVSTVAEETRNPKRDLPIGIIGSLIICTIIYIVVAAVFTGIIPYSVLVNKLATEQAEPLTMALQYANIPRLGNLIIGIVAFGSVVAHTAVLLVFQLGQPRIFFSMARDGSCMWTILARERTPSIDNRSYSSHAEVKQAFLRCQTTHDRSIARGYSATREEAMADFKARWLGCVSGHLTERLDREVLKYLLLQTSGVGVANHFRRSSSLIR